MFQLEHFPVVGYVDKTKTSEKYLFLPFFTADSPSTRTAHPVSA